MRITFNEKAFRDAATHVADLADWYVGQPITAPADKAGRSLSYDDQLRLRGMFVDVMNKSEPATKIFALHGPSAAVTNCTAMVYIDAYHGEDGIFYGLEFEAFLSWVSSEFQGLTFRNTEDSLGTTDIGGDQVTLLDQVVALTTYAVTVLNEHIEQDELA